MGYSGVQYAFNNFYTELLSNGLPEQGAWRRYLDKIARLTQLSRNPNVENVDDPLLDVLRDKANYDIITSLLILETMLNDDDEGIAELGERVLNALMETGRQFKLPEVE